MSKYIVDLSHHQKSSKINYATFCPQLELAIIRVQYGKATIDKEYKNHIAKMKQFNVPYGVYAWTRGKSILLMEEEAKLFYERAKDQNPSFYVLDVEEKTMADMRSGISAFVKQLKKLTDKPIGLYVANHLYKSFNLNVSEFNFVWIPRYGMNDGVPHTKPDFDCDMWQYTSNGRITGYTGALDLNMLVNGATMDIFKVKAITTETEKKTNLYPVPTIVLKSGCSGEYVKWLQTELVFAGFNIVVDGEFGKGTLAAVKSFQKANGLKVDGICGAITRKYLLQN